jgi:hypothetical protein
MGADIHDPWPWPSGRLVLIHISDKPAVYARIEAIDPDVKPGWWRVKFLMLTFPPHPAVWILEREQIDGKPFTMGGTPVRLEHVVSPETAQEEPAKTTLNQDAGPARDGAGGGKLISLQERRRPR